MASFWSNLPNPGNIPAPNTWFGSLTGNGAASGGATPSSAAVGAGDPSYTAFGGATNANSGATSGWVNPGGVPSMFGANGQLDPMYTVPGASAPGSSYNSAPLKNLETYASSTTASPWLTSANAEVENERQAGLGQAATAASAQVGQADTNAATHGGLTGGGAARIAAVGEQGQAAADQGVNLAAAQATNQNTVQDWQNKLAVSEGLPAQEAQAASTISQPQEFNAAQTQGAETSTANNAIQGFGQSMNAYLGNVLGSATAASKKSGI